MKNIDTKYLCSVLSDVLNGSTSNEEVYEVMMILDKFSSNKNPWKKFSGSRKLLLKELRLVLRELTLP